MVYISKVYTKAGDGGDTMLASGGRVRKHAVRIEAYGAVDELNACIGLVRIELAREPRRTGAEVVLDEMDAQLARIQQELFNLGAELATADGDHERKSKTPKLRVEDRHVLRLEKELDAWNGPLPPLQSFILPGGGPVGASCHLARTVCRRAERRAVQLADTEGEVVHPEALRYLNRLSDYLFVLGRAVAHRMGDPETLWHPVST
jgi:cob(I)alamin adenosyltransferase